MQPFFKEFIKFTILYDLIMPETFEFLLKLDQIMKINYDYRNY